MRMKTQRILAALLCLVLLLALAPAGWADGDGGDRNPQQNGNPSQVEPVQSTITVDLSQNNYDGDIYKAQVMADLYLVMPAVKNEAYNSYDLDFDHFNSELADLKVFFQKAIYGEKYGTSEYVYDPNYRPDYAELMSTHVIPFILDKEKSFTRIANQGVADETSTSFQFTGVAPGMYILVPHGQDLTDRKDYIKTVKNTTTGTEQSVTVAQSDSYEYLFTPQLIFVPTKDPVDNVIATWNPGEWKNVLTVSLKSEQKPRYGDLKLVKTLNRYAGSKSVVAVFHVKATYKQEVVFTNSYMFELTKDTPTQTVTIEKKIPVGAIVEVTEDYSSSYKQIGSTVYTYEVGTGTEDAETPLIQLNKLLTATITNEPGETPPGAGVINRITYHDQADWDVHHDNVASNTSEG